MQLLPDSGPAPAPEQRRIPRHQLSAYLAVYNSLTGRPFGYIGNLSSHGIMLLCAVPVVAHHSFSVEYDTEKPVKVTGSVTKLQWTKL